MKKVLVAGTFDIIHSGHLKFLNLAKKRGDFLIIVVARDKNVKSIKKRLPKFNEKTRQMQLKKLNIADQVILGNTKDKLKVVRGIKPDIICLGYDQRVNIKQLKHKLKEYQLSPKIIRLKAYKPHLYKSSKIRTIKT